MGSVVIAFDLCKSCGYCMNACPKSVLKVGKKVNKLGYQAVEADSMDECIGCGNCAVACPEAAIAVYREERSAG